MSTSETNMAAQGMPAQKPVKKENKVVRFFVTLLWLVISVGVDLFAIFAKALPVGIGIELAFFIITFCVPYLRKKGSATRWFGWLGLLSAIGLAGMMFGF